jgi:hypothetical protein
MSDRDERTLEGARLRLCAAAREWAKLVRAVERVEKRPAELDARMEAAESRLLRLIDAETELERNRPS